MWNFCGQGVRLCDGVNRREVLRAGSLGFGALGTGLSLADLLRAEAVPARPAEPAAPAPGFGKARSCIVLFLMGGPDQHSTWDPKPDAPAEVRGAFGAIASSVPGIWLSELFPQTAQVAHRLCLLRAVSTGDHAHSSSGYYMLTGRPHQPMNFENANPGAPNDFPSVGGIVRRLAADSGGLPRSVTLPNRIFNTDGSVWPGQDAGFLGRGHDPWLIQAQPDPGGLRISEIDLPDDLSPHRLQRRRSLLDQLERSLERLTVGETAIPWDGSTKTAFELLRGSHAMGAFRLDHEPEQIRRWYGETPFGYSVLQARRLIEAGVRLVQVNWYRGPDEPPQNPCWDSHTDETNRLKNVLAPPTDQALAALIMDLEARGMLDETLVVCMAEFGRSPRLDTSGGRNHWGSVFSVVLAGGGIRGGLVHGSSDRIGAYPRDGKVPPEDLVATIFHCLGIHPETEIRDRLGRPVTVSRGEVIRAIL